MHSGRDVNEDDFKSSLDPLPPPPPLYRPWTYPPTLQPSSHLIFVVLLLLHLVGHGLDLHVVLPQ